MSTLVDQNRGLTPEVRAAKALEWFDGFVTTNQEIIDAVDVAYRERKEPGTNATDSIKNMRMKLERGLSKALEVKGAETTKLIVEAVNVASLGMRKWRMKGMGVACPPMDVPLKPMELHSTPTLTVRVDNSTSVQKLEAKMKGYEVRPV